MPKEEAFSLKLNDCAMFVTGVPFIIIIIIIIYFFFLLKHFLHLHTK